MAATSGRLSVKIVLDHLPFGPLTPVGARQPARLHRARIPAAPRRPGAHCPRRANGRIALRLPLSQQTHAVGDLPAPPAPANDDPPAAGRSASPPVRSSTPTALTRAYEDDNASAAATARSRSISPPPRSALRAAGSAEPGGANPTSPRSPRSRADRRSSRATPSLRNAHGASPLRTASTASPLLEMNVAAGPSGCKSPLARSMGN